MASILVPPDATDAPMVRQFLGQHLRLLRAATPQDTRRDLDAAQMATAVFPLVQTAPILEAIAFVDRGVAEVQKANVTRFATWLFPSVLDHMRREHGLWASLLQGGLDLDALSTLARQHGQDVVAVTESLLDPNASGAAVLPLDATLPVLMAATTPSAVLNALQAVTNALHDPAVMSAPKAMPTWWSAHEDAEDAALIVWLRRALSRVATGDGSGKSA